MRMLFSYRSMRHFGRIFIIAAVSTLLAWACATRLHVGDFDLDTHTYPQQVDSVQSFAH